MYQAFKANYIIYYIPTYFSSVVWLGLYESYLFRLWYARESHFCCQWRNKNVYKYKTLPAFWKAYRIYQYFKVWLSVLQKCLPMNQNIQKFISILRITCSIGRNQNQNHKTTKEIKTNLEVFANIFLGTSVTLDNQVSCYE